MQREREVGGCRRRRWRLDRSSERRRHRGDAGASRRLQDRCSMKTAARHRQQAGQGDVVAVVHHEFRALSLSQSHGIGQLAVG